jgi:hypothetical protein
MKVPGTFINQILWIFSLNRNDVSDVCKGFYQGTGYLDKIWLICVRGFMKVPGTFISI